MKSKIIIALFSIIVIIFFSGCGGSSMTVQQPIEKSLTPFSNFLFYCESNVAEDVTEEITELEAEVAKEVKTLAVFDSIMLGDTEEVTDGTLKVKATIQQIDKVSGAERFFLGAFAGSASMTIDVLFSDAATGETLGAFSITGESGGTGLSGGTSEAITETAIAIRDLIKENRQ